MSFSLADLTVHPNELVQHYSRFRVAERLLLTGHSHQAWPDCGFEAQQQAWQDAAEWVDNKWEWAFAQAERVRNGFRTLLDDPSGRYSLGASTFELLVRLLSALPLATRSRLVTTDSEFHSLRRLLARLEEAGLQIERLPAHPTESLGERLAAATDSTTAAVLTSTVFYNSGQIAGDLEPAMAACHQHGAILVLDVYHQLNVVPFSLRAAGLENTYVVGGGYKYCQLGEGNAFLRFPADCELRPVITGWYAEFGQLTQEVSTSGVAYNAGDDRFAGATYDPTSHYRAAAVFDFFSREGLDAHFLRRVSQHQIGLLCRLFDDLELDTRLISRDHDVPTQRIAGFLALYSPQAEQICQRLREQGVFADQRAGILRLGPAPYLSDRQLEKAVAVLGSVVASL